MCKSKLHNSFLSKKIPFYSKNRWQAHCKCHSFYVAGISYEVFVWFLPYVLVRSLWTGLYLAFFLGCLMSNRNKSSGGLEEDLFQHNNFCFLFVKEMYLYLV